MHNQEDKDKLLKSIVKDMTKHAKPQDFWTANNTLLQNNWEELPQLSYGVHKEVPCLSSAVSIAYSKELGRHLVANQDIKMGI